MTLAATKVVADQSVIAVFLIKRLTCGQRVDHEGQLRGVFARGTQLAVVFAEGSLVADTQHSSSSSSSMAAKSSSALLNERPSSRGSWIAAIVSAFGRWRTNSTTLPCSLPGRRWISSMISAAFMVNKMTVFPDSSSLQERALGCVLAWTSRPTSAGDSHKTPYCQTPIPTSELANAGRFPGRIG